MFRVCGVVSTDLFTICLLRWYIVYLIYSFYSRYYGDALRGLYPLFGESEPDNAVRDNAAGAVARMIMVHPETIPLNQVCRLTFIVFGFESFPLFVWALFDVVLSLGATCFLESSSSKRRSRGIHGSLQLHIPSCFVI